MAGLEEVWKHNLILSTGSLFLSSILDIKQ